MECAVRSAQIIVRFRVIGAQICRRLRSTNRFQVFVLLVVRQREVQPLIRRQGRKVLHFRGTRRLRGRLIRAIAKITAMHQSESAHGHAGGQSTPVC